MRCLDVVFFFLFAVVLVELVVKYDFCSGFSGIGSISPAAITNLQIHLLVL